MVSHNITEMLEHCIFSDYNDLYLPILKFYQDCFPRQRPDIIENVILELSMEVDPQQPRTTNAHQEKLNQTLVENGDFFF